MSNKADDWSQKAQSTTKTSARTPHELMTNAKLMDFNDHKMGHQELKTTPEMYFLHTEKSELRPGLSKRKGY